MVEILIPKTKMEETKIPLIFLAGPIKGTNDWRSSAVEIFESFNLPLIIASPSKRVNLINNKTTLIPISNDFSRQREWENHYLDIASRNGSILFWFPEETIHNCEKSYGAMTRVEIGQWMTEYKYNNSIHLCVGTDGKFSEIDTIRYDLSVFAPDIKICEILEETCNQAINFIQPRK